MAKKDKTVEVQDKTENTVDEKKEEEETKGDAGLSLVSDEETKADETERVTKADLDKKFKKIIHEPLVWRIGMLEEQMKRVNAEIMLKGRLYNDRIIDIRREASLSDKELRAEAERTKQQMDDLRKVISEKHDINMLHYGYDDETGMLNKLDDDAIKQIDERVSSSPAAAK